MVLIQMRNPSAKEAQHSKKGEQTEHTNHRQISGINVCKHNSHCRSAVAQRCSSATPRRWLPEWEKEFIAVLGAWACYAVSASRRPDAVEPFRIILPLGIAEI